MYESHQSQPHGNWVDTTAGGEDEAGSPASGGTPGSGANEITRSGLPNADPDGQDLPRSERDGADTGPAPAADQTSGT